MKYYNVCVTSIVALGNMTLYSRTYKVHYLTVPVVACTI